MLRAGLAQDTPWFSGMRFILARALDRCADFIRPTASMSDIRMGMTPKQDRKVRAAIVGTFGPREPICLPLRYAIPVSDLTAKDISEYQEWGGR